ncbi:radical SAM protein, partial [Thermodesulfobacteriota bacterium]
GRCNMRCRHCHVPAQQGKLLDFARFGSQLVEDLQQLGTREVIISGGEPTLEMDLTCAVAGRLIDAGIVSILFTNAYQLTDKDLGRLLDAGIFTMHVSLDGIEPTHDWFRRTPGGFSATLANIEAATRMGFHIIVRMTLTRDNIAEVRQVADAAHNAGAALFKIRPVVPSGRANQAMCPTPEQLAQAVKTMIALGKKRQVSFSPSCFEYVYGAPAEPRSGCPGKILHIDHFGNISPCGYVRVPLGNLANHRLPEVFYGARMNALRRLPLPDVCSPCDYVEYCHGGCRACVLQWGLRADEPDTYCPITAGRTRRAYVSGAVGDYQITYQRRGLIGLIEIKSLPTGESVLLRTHDDRSNPAESSQRKRAQEPNDAAGSWFIELHTSGNYRSVDLSAAENINAGFCSIQSVRISRAHETGLGSGSPLFVVDLDGFRICCLSSPDRVLSGEEIGVLAPVDLVIALFDGSQARFVSGSTLPGMMRLLGARILIPIPVEDEDWGSFPTPVAGGKVHRFPENRVFVDLNSLPQKPEVWILTNPSNQPELS